MKNKKFKLFASLTSLVMVVAVMAVGVWAATQAKVTIGATATFSATGIAATVSEQGGSDLFTVAQNQVNSDVASGEASWELEFTIDDETTTATLEGKTIVKTLVITNDGANDVYYKVAPKGTAPTADASKIAVIKVEVESHESATPIGAGDSIELDITYTVVDHTGASFGASDVESGNVVIQEFTVELNNNGTFN